MMFLDFEKPIADLHEQLVQLQQIGNQTNKDVTQLITDLSKQLHTTKKNIYTNLSRWQKVQLSRHPKRPYTLFYIHQICDTFTELHGDRYYGDDKAIVGGFGKIEDKTVMIIGHQKGHNTKTRQYRNFGMAMPEGYRKALRLMKLAEKFNRPIVCFIDTPGAYPGIEAEERGQSEAIARNLLEMTRLKVPIICIVIGEGASGGALGIGIADRILMLENTWYAVISPESCSSILWRNWEHKVKAAEELKLTAKDMRHFGIIDDIIREPLGGAHQQPKIMAQTVKQCVLQNLHELQTLSPQQLIQQRILKFSSIGSHAQNGY